MLKNFLKYLLLAALFTPLIKFSNTIFPFVFAKAIFFQIIISSASIIYIFLLMNGKIGWPKQSRIFFSIGAFLLAITMASLFGVDFFHSFWDAPERMTGIFNLLYYVLFFVMLITVFETKEDGKQLALVAWTGGVLLMLSGYAQLFDSNFWGYEARSRIAGLLNNPIFYAIAMVWLVFLSLFLASITTNKKYKVIFWLSSLAAVYAIFLSQTRGAVIGAAGGFLMFALGEVLTIKNTKRKRIIILVLASSLSLIFFLWLAKDTPIVKRLPITYYLNISPFAGTGATRLLAWKTAYQGFLERPFFGWGLNNFNIIFNKFYNPETLRYTAYETWFDRTHNVTLEFLSTTGVIGLLAYLAIFLTALISIIKAIRQEELARPLLFLSSALVAYFIQNQFALDQPTSLLFFFLFLALISIYTESDRKIISFTGRPPRLIMVLGILGIALSIYRFNIMPLYAGYLNVAGVATTATNYQFAREQFLKALAMKHPYRLDSVIEFAQSAVKGSAAGLNIGEARIRDFILAETEMKNLIKAHPRHTYYWYLLGRLYSEWGRYDQLYFSLAEQAYKEAEKLSPRRQQIFYGLGQLYMFAKEYEKAEAVFRHLVALEPRVGEAHWYLGLALHQLDKNQETLFEMEQAYRFSYVPQSQDELGFFVKFFEAQKRYEDMALIYDRYIGDREPTNGELYAKEAAAWLAARNFVRARKALALAIAHDSSLKSEAEIFLKIIEEVEKQTQLKITK